MNLGNHIDKLILALPEISEDCNYDPFIDLTLLDTKASSKQLADLKQLANSHQTAAICVYPEHLHAFQDLQGIARATVVNFPEGNLSIEHIYQLIDFSLHNKVSEIDYVFPYKEYLSGNRSFALHQTKMIIDYCQKLKLPIKIILESAAFESLDLLYQVSLEILQFKPNFLKTSTGKYSKGARLSAVFAMIAAIKDSKQNSGIKISGGIRTKEQIRTYFSLIQFVLNKKLDPSWLRIGSSKLPN